MVRLLLIVAIAVAAYEFPAQARDRVGYYYPPITSEEVFKRDLGDLSADRRMRVNFVTQLTKAQLEAPEKPRFAIFAKGGEADSLIIVALDDEVFKTLFRARAVMAQLTSQSRSTSFFIDNKIEVSATWFDLLKLMGFEDLVISDGETWSHKVTLR